MKHLTFEERLEEERQYLIDHLKLLRKFKEVRCQTWGGGMRSHYYFMATFSLILGDVIQAKKYYYKAALINVEIRKIFKENRYPNLKKSEELNFTGLFGTSFIHVLLCDSDDLLLEFATIIEPGNNRYPEFNLHITSAMKYLVLEDFERARLHAEEANKQKYFKLPYKGFSKVVLGILNKDVVMVNEGIQHRINHYKKENSDSILKISDEANALAKLAIRFGMQPDISSQYMNRDVIEKSEGISYEGVDEILDALAVADKKNRSLDRKLFGWTGLMDP
jgi:hypothetical protein